MYRGWHSCLDSVIQNSSTDINIMKKYPSPATSFPLFQWLTYFLVFVFPKFLNKFLALLFFSPSFSSSYHFMYFILGIMFFSRCSINEVLYFIL